MGRNTHNIVRSSDGDQVKISVETDQKSVELRLKPRSGCRACKDLPKRIFLSSLLLLLFPRTDFLRQPKLDQTRRTMVAFLVVVVVVTVVSRGDTFCFFETPPQCESFCDFLFVLLPADSHFLLLPSLFVTSVSGQP